MSHHFDCPDCGHALRIRSSHPLGETVRHIKYECLNAECGASFVAQSALLERLSMPSQPSASVTIPLSPHVNRERLRQLLTDAPRGEYRATTMAPPNGELFDSPAAGPPEPQPA